MGSNFLMEISLVFMGSSRDFMGFYRFSWVFMGFHGFRGFRGFSWIFTDLWFCGFSGIFMDVRGFSWIFMVPSFSAC